MKYGHNKIAAKCRLALCVLGTVAGAGDAHTIRDFSKANEGEHSEAEMDQLVSRWVIEYTSKKPPSRIPIKAAQAYGEKYGQHMVIAISHGIDGISHLVTWGKTREFCQRAATAGKKAADALGIPLL